MASRSVFALALLLLVVAAPATAASPSRCDACLFSWRMLEDVLDDPDVVQTAVSLVEARCPYFGPAASDKCKALAEGLLPAVAEWLASPSTAYQFCGCGAPQAVLQTQKPVRDVDATCALCQLVVDQVQTVINSTGVLDKINATAQQACAQLPAEMAAYCSSFVNKYESLLEDLVTKAPPEEVCEILGVCTPQLVARLSTAQFTRALDATTTRTTTTTWPQWRGGAARAGCPNKLIRSVQLARLSAAPGVPQGALGDSCDYCKMAVIEAHSLIGNPAVQQSILNYTHTLCDTFQSWNQTCDLYVDAYAPLAFSMLQQYLVPDTLCAEVGACPGISLTALDGPAKPAQGLFAAVVDALLQAIGLRVPHEDEALEGQRGPVTRMKL